MANRNLSFSASLTLFVFATLSLSGCPLGLGAQVHLSGSTLPPWLPALELGATREQVVEILGPPLADAEKTESLEWIETIRPRGCRMYILGFIPLGREPLLTRRVEATFVGDRLADATVTYLDRRGRVTSTESLMRRSENP